jgi:YD repeat-containing protein
MMMKETNCAFTFVVLPVTVLLLMPLTVAAQATPCDVQNQYFFPDPPIPGAYRCDHVDTNLSLCYVKNNQCRPKNVHLQTHKRCPWCGSPVDLTTGNTYIDQTDFALPGLGGGLSLTRTWNSMWPLSEQQYEVGIFGTNWRSTYEERIYMGSDNYEKYLRADGSIWSWGAGSGGLVPVAPADEVALLTLNNGIWTIAFKNGTKKTFNYSNGLLTSIIDRNGNTTTVAYDSNNRLSTVTDAAGRTITFNYPNASSQLVSSVVSAAGTFTYNYDGQFLTRVTRPDNKFMTFEYGDGSPLYGVPPLVTAVKDTDGKLLEGHHYDAIGRGVSSTRANGVDSVTITYPQSLSTPPRTN